MKITFSLFLKYWFLLTCLVNWICIYIWLILILWLFLFVQLSNQPPIINTYLNISICLCSICRNRLSCMNIESCFWKCLSFVLYVLLNVLWNKWNRRKNTRGWPGQCPKGYLNTSFRSTLWCCIILTIWPNKSWCSFNGTISFTPTFTFFHRFENVFNPSFFDGSKNQLFPLFPIVPLWMLSLHSRHGFLHSSSFHILLL